MDIPKDNIARLLQNASLIHPRKIALTDRKTEIRYQDLAKMAQSVATQLATLGLSEGDRIALIVDKRIETVAAIFGCFLANIILVPINPQLKARQISHLLQDSGARLVMGTENRKLQLANLEKTATLPVILSGDGTLAGLSENSSLPSKKQAAAGFENIPLATLFYTSGSTGLPKAVACTHKNILAGAESVCTYLGNVETDVILAILPLSFDAGFSQLTTGFQAGAHIVLQDYLMPNDISRACTRYGVTGITGVPAIWTAALAAKWEDTARHTIRYFANTGGHLPHERILQLQKVFPNAQPFPMYGLTEAFRSAYLPPDRVLDKKGSMGRAIPGATLCVVDDAGQECLPNVPGELIHAGPTVAAGYWNNPEETAKRFRAAPPALLRQGITGTVVFSGDFVQADDEGFLYYQSRRDAQIKISGNRISFAEIEDIALTHPDVRACIAGGHKTGLATDPVLVLFLETDGSDIVIEAVHSMLRAELPGYTVPSKIFALDHLILNNNNKYDIKRMILDYCEQV